MTKAGAWAVGFGFQILWARPKPVLGRHQWLGLAWPKQAWLPALRRAMHNTTFKSWSVSCTRQCVVNDKTECRDRGDHYLNSLSSLSLPQLTSVTTSLHCATSHPKNMQIRANFFEQRSGVWQIVRHSSSPCALSVSLFFWTDIRTLSSTHSVTFEPLIIFVQPIVVWISFRHHTLPLPTCGCIRPLMICQWILDCVAHPGMRSCLVCIPFLPTWGHNIVLDPYVRAVHLSCFTSGLGSGILVHFPTIRSFKFYFRFFHFTTTHL